MVKYDLFVMIEYVIQKIGNEGIYYVGYLQGIEQVFVGFSFNFELGRKVKIFFVFVFVGNMLGIESLVKFLVLFVKDFEVN